MIRRHVSFRCEQCGLCCRAPSPEFDRGDGRCKYLNKNLCSIYKDRPGMCNVDWAYENLYKDQFSNILDYYKYSRELCKEIINKGEELKL